jgi:hypothetical protein
LLACSSIRRRDGDDHTNCRRNLLLILDEGHLFAARGASSMTRLDLLALLDTRRRAAITGTYYANCCRWLRSLGWHVGAPDMLWHKGERRRCFREALCTATYELLTDGLEELGWTCPAGGDIWQHPSSDARVPFEAAVRREPSVRYVDVP